ncbi:cytochrome P450 [Collybia nuda]|uniref:Cytochrome P450 n=1 Tax=Collybia nuda TaxID=64659 RepID=A0A9P5Y4A0_9AGAR|nr:cytochrome P450 [Collybia nuda]
MMITTRDLIAVGSTALALTFAFLYRRYAARSLPFPPGPKPSLLTGNAHQIPRTLPWLTYASWSKIYGPLVFVRLFKMNIIVLNTAKSALDLLEARSTIYSDRPLNTIGRRHETVFSMSSQNPRFKIYRKVLHTGLNPRAVQDYNSVQLQETLTLLKALFESPELFFAHIRRNAAAQIMKISYGYQVESDDDKFVQMIEEGFKLSAEITSRKFWMWMQMFPILRYVPEWFHGANLQRVVREFNKIDQVPYDWAKNNIASGNYVESFTSKHLQDNTTLRAEEKDDIIKYCSGALYVGGAETTVSALIGFFWLMSMYPDVQKRAQQEVEQIIGDRLPTPADYSSLPYILALMKEVLRWAPVAPLGLRHRVLEDDVYEGYLIPKGTTIMANIWAITHDPELYPSPDNFDPTRHLGEDAQTDPFKFVFGFGRRTCPGSHFAEVSLFLNMASILATFDIKKALGPDGKEIDPPKEWTTGVTSHLKPFNCRIIPRSQDITGILGL